MAKKMKRRKLAMPVLTIEYKMAQDDITKKYGKPDHAYVQKYCVLWPVQDEYPWFPTHSFLVAIPFRDKLRIWFKDLEAKGLHKEIKTYDGCYNDRDVRGSSAISLHAWAMALDLNAAQNPMVVGPTPAQRQGKWSKAFVASLLASGLFYGGNFKRRADPMHLGLYNG